MKKIFFTVALAMFSAFGASVSAQRIDIQGVERELPRSRVVSHDSRADAVVGTAGASRYLQPLLEWTRAESADAVTFSGRFKIPFGWIDRQQFLHIGRVSGAYVIAINGTEVARTETSATPAEFDITRVAKEGANDLQIRLLKSYAAQVLEGGRSPQPATIDDVYILSQPRVRVRDVAIATRMDGTNGLLELGVILKSHQLNRHNYLVHWELLNPAGDIVAEARKEVEIDMRREDTVRFFANIPRIVPWSTERPQLYTLFVRTQNEGRYREHVAFRVGFRTIELSERSAGSTPRLMLNGRVCESVEVMDSPTWNDLRRADSLGILVAVRADVDSRQSGLSRKVGGNPSNDPRWTAAYLERTLGAYHTSKNHASAAAFVIAQRSANGLNLYESYLAVRQLESSRPVVYLDSEGEWNTDLRALPEGGRTAPKKTQNMPQPTTKTAAETATETATGAGLTLTEIDASNGCFKVRNGLVFTPFVGEATYRIEQARKVVASGFVPLEVMPGQTREFDVPMAAVVAGRNYSIVVEIASERATGNYLPAGDENLKLYRRIDLPLPESSRTVVARHESKHSAKSK